MRYYYWNEMSDKIGIVNVMFIEYYCLYVANVLLYICIDEELQGYMGSTNG